MTPASEPNSGQLDLSDDLVAYLDGELDADVSRQLEERLTENSQTRDRVRGLERAWDLLDELPRSEADEMFTHSTVEMLAVEVSHELEAERAVRPGRRLRKWLLAAGGLALAGFFGVVAINEFWPSPDDRVLRDLPVLQQLDEFEQIGDVNYLRVLQKQERFTDEED